MNVLVLFGSKSDAYIYEPLKTQLLSLGNGVDFRFLSVHRSPELLNKELESTNPDIVVAGAGLAAHLPGILSSKLLLPIIGIPCTPALGGLDALLSMIQMPFGIPVLTTAPDHYQTALEFIRDWAETDLRFSSVPVQIIVERGKPQQPYIEALLAKAKNIAAKAGIEYSLLHEPVRNAANICLVEIDPRDPEAPIPFLEAKTGSAKCLRIYVPVFKDGLYRDPTSGLYLLKRMKASGGLWVGANNIGNGFLAGLQLANASGAYSAVLTNAKKGYIHYG